MWQVIGMRTGGEQGCRSFALSVWGSWLGALGCTMVSIRGNLSDAWSGCEEPPCPCLFPVLSRWPCILPQSSLLASLPIIVPLGGRLHGWLAVEMSLSWSDGRFSPPLHKQRDREAVTWAKCWVHQGTWSFPLPLSARLHHAKHAGEAWWTAMGFGGRMAHVPSGLPNTWRSVAA